ncbi:MAG: (2Fe-2S)-binding protein [Pseudomonadota bacterium]|nr:(2Fe-2S)-binding protein [Pseudomonadota bacterium]
MNDLIPIRFRLNGIDRKAAVEPNQVLADLLRDDLGQTDVRVSCDQGVCGVCSVLVDGVPVTACLTPAFRADGCEIVTAKGLASGSDALSDVQRAFVDVSAFQCGFCTPGMVISATALLAAHPAPDRATIVGWLGANVCRCTGYQMIIEAIELAAARRAETLHVRIGEPAD